MKIIKLSLNTNYLQKSVIDVFIQYGQLPLSNPQKLAMLNMFASLQQVEEYIAEGKLDYTRQSEVAVPRSL